MYDIIPNIEEVLRRERVENVLIHVTLNKKLCEDISTSGIDIFRFSMIGYNE